MGIYIYLAVSKAVTQQEWEAVYEETLLLVNKFPFAEVRQKQICGIETRCLMMTKEREHVYGSGGENSYTGWETDGDYVYMRCAETYGLKRKLPEKETQEEAAAEGDADAMLGVLAARMDGAEAAAQANPVHHLWGNKTQGEPYHIYLLAVACLIESRLGTKAYVYGDITRGQCRKAVRLANSYLQTPIGMPDSCDPDRLAGRILSFPVKDALKPELFIETYSGTKDDVFGAGIRKYFTERMLKEYWRSKFAEHVIGTAAFERYFKEYLQWGFALDELTGYVRFTDEKGKPRYEEFVKRVMDAKLHKKYKNCTDVLQIHPEEEAPYGIWTLLAQFAFAGAANRKIDRYIPVDEIRRILNAAIGNKCNVDQIMDAYLTEEAGQKKLRHSVESMSQEELQAAMKQDASEVLTQIMDKKKRSMQEECEKYDIDNYRVMKFYEAGDTMHPDIRESLATLGTFFEKLPAEDCFRKLMEMEPEKRCKWLVLQNRFMLIRDKDWEKIFSDIAAHEEAFVRYYTIMRFNMKTQNMVEMCTSVFINDELYGYCRSLAAQLNGE